MKKNENNKRKGNISLTGSLASLAREVQKNEEKPTIGKEINDERKENAFKNNLTTGRENNFDEVVKLAHELRNNNSNKSATVYVYDDIKKDVELLKRIEGLENVPLTAILSAIIDDFLRNNTLIIKELLNNSIRRF